MNGWAIFRLAVTSGAAQFGVVSYMSVTQKILAIPFCLSVFLAILGCIITFVPGAECDWFLVVALLAVSGLFIPRIRIGALLLLIFALYSAYGGYLRGVEYHQRHSSEQMFVCESYA